MTDLEATSSLARINKTEAEELAARVAKEAD